MSPYPPVALDVLRRLNESDPDYRHLLDAIETGDIEIKKALAKVAKIFSFTLETPGEMIRIDPELDEHIERRLWLQFFETLVYASATHRITKPAHAAEQSFNAYCQHLQDAIEHAEALAKSLHALEALQERHGFANTTPWRDPVEPLIATLELYGKASDNPVYAQLTALQARYINSRYWPTISQLLETLAGQLTESEITIKPARFDMEAVLIRLIDECHWYRSTRWSWHLPHHFIDQLSGAHLGALLYRAQGFDIPENIRGTVTKALRKIFG